MTDRDVATLPPRLQHEKQQRLTPKPRRGRRLGFLWLLLAAGLGYAGYRYFQANEQKRQAAEAAQAARMANRPVSVAATVARRGDIPVYLRGLGTVQAFNTVKVKSRVDGPIVAVNFQEGQIVKQGEVLVEIDPRPFQVQLEQAEGQMARDQAQLNDAKVNLARYQKLWDEQVIAKQQLDTQAAQVGQFEGAIKADQAAIDTAKLNLSFTQITAPISGRIGLRLVDAGNIVHASDRERPAGDHADAAHRGAVHDSRGQPAAGAGETAAPGAKLPVDAYDRADINKLATGTLLTVDNQIDPTTGTVAAEGGVREPRQCAVPEPVRQLPPAAGHATRRGDRARGGRAARAAGNVRVRR